MAPEKLRRFENFRLLGSDRLLRHSESSSGENPHAGEPFGALRQDLEGLARDQDRMELRLLYTKIKNLLGIKNISELKDKRNDEEWRDATHKRLVKLLSTSYGVEDSEEAQESFVQRSLAEANGVLRLFDHPENGLFRQYRSRLNQRNEVECMIDPLDLFLLAFSEEADPRARFEARRKLVLMEAAMRSVSVTEPLDEQIDRFLNFLNQYVWQGKVGETRLVEFLSEHRITDYACQQVIPFDVSKGKIRLSNYRRYNAFEMRPFLNRFGKESLALVEHRKKDIPSLIIKMLRKDTKDPLKVDDYIGLKCVFQDKHDIYQFLETMMYAAEKAGTVINYEEPYDTIQNNDGFRVTNSGSSQNLEIVKVHMQLFGMRVELLMHTVRTYLDSKYHDDTGFESFSVRRLFDSGVAAALYPQDIYGVDVNYFKDALLRDRQAAVRSSGVDMPPERLPDQKRTIRYTESDLMADTVRILEQLPEIPDTIIAISAGGMQLATVLKDIFKGVRIIAYDKNDPSQTPVRPDTEHVLIVDDIGRNYAHVQKVLEKNPQARVAVLVEKLPVNPEISNLPFKHDVITGRNVGVNDWVNFFWNPTEFEQGYVKLHAVVLPYYPFEDGVKFLAQKMDDGHLKLIGGMKESKDISLEETIHREAREEMQLPETFQLSLQQLGDVRFEYEDPKRRFPQIGFVRGYAAPMPTADIPAPGEHDITEYVWATPDEFIEQSRWGSYKNAVKVWAEKLQALQKKQQE